MPIELPVSTAQSPRFGSSYHINQPWWHMFPALGRLMGENLKCEAIFGYILSLSPVWDTQKGKQKQNLKFVEEFLNN